MKINDLKGLKIEISSSELEKEQFKELSVHSGDNAGDNEFQEEIVWRCLNCGKELRYSVGDLYVGGHPTNGWIKVHIERHGTSLREIGLIREKSDFTFCSVACMKEYDDYSAP